MHIGYDVAEVSITAIQKNIIDASGHDIFQKTGMQNALNLLCRDHILEKCITVFREISRLTHCMYSTPSELLICDQIIPSSTGIQNGDQLGPYSLHCLSVTLNTWYLNNNTIINTAKSVIDFTRKIIANLNSFGLEVNSSKTDVISYDAESKKRVDHA